METAGVPRVSSWLERRADGLGAPGRVWLAALPDLVADLRERWALAVEEYDDFGPLHQFYAGNQQAHQLYGVIDHATKGLDIEAGVGFGLTSASDRITLKLILSRDLN